MSEKCPTCGRAIAKPRAKKASARGIAFGGRVPAEQRRWYLEAMDVKHGKLVWSPYVNEDRFGARGGYVTPERAAELARERGEIAPKSRVELLLDAEETRAVEPGEWRPHPLLQRIPSHV